MFNGLLAFDFARYLFIFSFDFQIKLELLMLPLRLSLVRLSSSTDSRFRASKVPDFRDDNLLS